MTRTLAHRKEMVENSSTQWNWQPSCHGNVDNKTDAQHLDKIAKNTIIYNLLHQKMSLWYETIKTSYLVSTEP
jgi:hypothetical protein